MSEDKMREEFERKFVGYVFTRNAFGHYVNFDLQEMWRGWKAATEACAAIKDAEISARDLMIKELREFIKDIKCWFSEHTMVGAGLRESADNILAKSEHHNSLALEKMLLEARIEGAEEYRLLDEFKAKLAGLNKE